MDPWHERMVSQKRRWDESQSCRIQFYHKCHTLSRKVHLKWDGKDDAGNSLPTGTYKVLLEVVREHGAYEILQQEIECKKKDQRFQLQGSKEVNEVTIDYKKKS